MNYDELLADLNEEDDAFRVALRMVDCAFAHVGLQKKGALIEAFQTGSEFSDEDRLKYAHALDRCFADRNIEGWTRLKARLNNAEAHLLRDMLLDNGVGAKLRGAHQTAADVLRPSSRAEIWIRPWDVTKARGLMPELDGLDEEMMCKACGEMSPSHFAACWQCGQQFGSVTHPGVD